MRVPRASDSPANSRSNSSSVHSLRSNSAQALLSGLAALMPRMKSFGSPFFVLYRLNA